ncbi:MAG: ribonuclease R [Kiloniellaceae bacterium]
MAGKKDPGGKDKAASAPFPTKEQVLAFINESAEPVGKREIARAFRIKGSNDRIRLKALLKELKQDGLLEKQPSRRLSGPGRLPNVLVVEVSEMDEDGELLARPTVWDDDKGAPPRIYVAPDNRSRAVLAMGERALVRLQLADYGTYEAHVIRKLDRPTQRVLGVYELGDQGGRLRPTDKRAKKDFILRAAEAGGAAPGELVLAEILPQRGRRDSLGLRSVRVVERLGRGDDPRSLSLITLHEHGLISEFPQKAVAEAEAATAAPLGRRQDLRDIPLVTIDGADARDFDDAVYAEPDDDAKNPGGWHLLVAIADVAHYVTTDSALDRSAYARGNSTYFPDRVLPMLPTALSNGWCSLNPNEDRPCMAVHLWIDADGNAVKHKFVRGLMRSAARLTYEEVQAARDGQPASDGGPGDNGPVLAAVLPSLYGAFEALLKERHARGTLELDLPERKIRLTEDGRVSAIETRVRLDSHKLIEEFMIAAYVAAAKELERLRQPCMYRIHDKPDPLRLAALAEVLRDLGLRFNASQVVRPSALTQLLTKVAGKPEAPLVNDLILRAQSQAVYSPDNIGHFGLALRRYCHFTSPIRRYSDLLVHRALIRGSRMGDGALETNHKDFAEMGQHLSFTERRAASAERAAVDRFTTQFLSDRVGATFLGRINGVTRFGLFITLNDTGADGLIPIRSLPDDYYIHDEAHNRLRGRSNGKTYVLGETVEVRLVEARPLTGGMIFELMDGAGRSGGGTRGRFTPGARPTGGGRKKSGRSGGKDKSKKGRGKKSGKPARG